jgi:colanic acid/amylovoran biosynthesis glycosyltransferase
VIGTILRYFPTYSETFVYREIASLRASGLPLFVLTMRHRRLPELEAQSQLGGGLEELPRFPLYLPIVAGALRAWRRNPAGARDAVAWGRRHLRLKDVLKALWMADRLVRQGVTLLHVHFAGEGAEVAEIVRRVAGIPYGITVHARDLFVPRPSVPDLFDQARYLVCISAFNERWIAERYPSAAGKAVVARLGVPVDTFRPAPAPPAGRFPILAVSRMVEKKGLADLIAAIGILRDRGREVALTIAGDGKLRPSLEALVASLGLSDRVHMPGPLTQEQIQGLYDAGVGCVAIPAVVAEDGDMDGIPVALMEAMARAVPVVTTAVSGIPELVSDGIDGLCVPPRSPQALASAIASLMDSPERARELGLAGRAKVERDFSMETNVALVRSLLEKVDPRGDRREADRVASPGG